jgi:hypothetical protein
MNIRTKSLLESLVELSSSQDTSLIIESRGNNIISSAIALIETIQYTYGQELAEELEKRLILSIRGKNGTRFAKGAKKLRPIK